jgi:lipopolysaccharide/colanic/teichoic acid biosynthesis glycosyltransferase
MSVIFGRNGRETLIIVGRTLRRSHPSESITDQMPRIADAVIAGVLLVFALPLMIIVAVVIRWASPPGVRARALRWASRASVSNAAVPDDSACARRLENGRSQRRLTRVGAFLRYTRIEGLPQLLNVLKGDITMIDADARSPSLSRVNANADRRARPSARADR